MVSRHYLLEEGHHLDSRRFFQLIQTVYVETGESPLETLRLAAVLSFHGRGSGEGLDRILPDPSLATLDTAHKVHLEAVRI